MIFLCSISALIQNPCETIIKNGKIKSDRLQQNQKIIGFFTMKMGVKEEPFADNKKN
jgi:hypothetical protein